MVGSRAMETNFSLAFKNSRFPVRPIPQFPSGSFFPETSQGNSEKPPTPPPPPSGRMRDGRGGELGAGTRHCESGVCARVRRVRSVLTRKGTGFPLPQRSVFAQARRGRFLAL